MRFKQTPDLKNNDVEFRFIFPDLPEPALTIEQQSRNCANSCRAPNVVYYVNDAPTVSDAEYDALFRELEALEQAHLQFSSADSPTQRVGGAPLSQFAKVRHRVPMLSLANAFSDAEVRAFDQRMQDEIA